MTPSRVVEAKRQCPACACPPSPFLSLHARRCPYGDHEVVVSVGANGRSFNNKGIAVRDHLSCARKCPSFGGERPAKRSRLQKQQEPDVVGDKDSGEGGEEVTDRGDRPEKTKRGSGGGKSTFCHGVCDKAIEFGPAITTIVTVYALVFTPDDRVVYVGRTNDPARREREHASRRSGCRLVRNAFRRHGRSKFRLEPLLRCHAADAAANEQAMIERHGTLHPGGYNLHNTSAAGREEDDCYSMVPVCSGVIPFSGAADEASALSEAWADMAVLLEGVEDGSAAEADSLCRDILRGVHPDRAGTERSYSAGEVAAMVNSIRETITPSAQRSF
jgi:hypothetical protein